MTSETIVKDDQKLLTVDHSNWLNQPITQISRKKLDDQIALVVEYISSKSMDKDVSDQTIRHYAVQLKTLKTLKQVIYDTQTFVAPR